MPYGGPEHCPAKKLAPEDEPCKIHRSTHYCNEPFGHSTSHSCLCGNFTWPRNS